MEVWTPRLVLRAARAADRDAHVEGLRASLALHRPFFPAPRPGEDPAARFADHLARQEAGTCLRGLAFTHEGRLVAWANLNEIVRGATQSATAGWAVHAQFAGQGLMTEAVGALLDLAFAPPPGGLGLHRVAAGIMPENRASLRVAEKNGFRREGLALRLVEIGGVFRDHVQVAKLAEEHAGATVEPER